MSHVEWVELYIKIGFWMSLIGVVVKLGCLGWGGYPREVSWSRGEDTVSIVFGAVAVVFTWWLAWGYR